MDLAHLRDGKSRKGCWIQDWSQLLIDVKDCRGITACKTSFYNYFCSKTIAYLLLFFLPCVKDKQEKQDGEDHHDVSIALEQGKLVQLSAVTCIYRHRSLGEEVDILST